MPKQLRQYTIRNIPIEIDQILKKRCRETGKSFNLIALEALAEGVGKTIKPRRNFEDVIGSISEKEANTLEKEIRRQRQIDPELWK